MAKQKTLFLILLTLIFISPLVSFGQSALTGASLSMKMVPENPVPEQNIKFTLESYSFDLNRSKITWLVNGVEKKTAMGLREFIWPAGKNGEKTTIRAVITPPGESAKGIERTFTPSLVDLIYEFMSYTPPFYKGKALNPNQGVVLVTALPELVNTSGTKIPAQNIIYTWKKDGKVAQSSSGVGKNTFIFSGTVPIRDSLIQVIATSPEGNISASREIAITNNSPKIIFYENSPIYGLMFNKAIKNNVKMLMDEFSVIAIPYFFSVGYDITPDLEYVWTMNDQTVENQEPKNTFTVRQEKSGSGKASISLKINNIVRIFQFTDNSYSINFEKQ